MSGNCTHKKGCFMKERECLGRTIVVKSYRKSGNGAVGGGRKGNSGKKGTIYGTDESGKEVILAQCRAPTFRELSRELFATKLVPSGISIQRKGETRF